MTIFTINKRISGEYTNEEKVCEKRDVKQNHFVGKNVFMWECYHFLWSLNVVLEFVE